MDKPIINQFGSYPSMHFQRYERYLPSAYDESLSLLQKLNMVIKYLNQIGEATDDVIEQWNQVMEWVENDGLTEPVINQLNKWLNDGTLSGLINTTLFNQLNAQISDIDNRAILNVKKYGAIGDGNYHPLSSKYETLALAQVDFPFAVSLSEELDRCAIQKALNVCVPFDDSLYHDGFGGRVRIPKGTFLIDKDIIMRSNITIMGDGFANTLLKPIGTFDYVFNVKNTSHWSHMVNVTIEDLTIAPTLNTSSTLPVRPLCSGINFTYTAFTALNRVQVMNIAGIAVNHAEAFDFTENSVYILFCGTVSTPAYTMLGTSEDTTNAGHIFGMRIEQCLYLMKCEKWAQNQFVSCKFEWGIDVQGGVNGSGMTFGYANDGWGGNNNTFIGCCFVTGVDAYPLVDIFTNNRGFTFTACSWITPSEGHGWAIRSQIQGIEFSPQFDGCYFQTMGKCFNGGFINLSNVSFDQCKAPVIDTEYSLLVNLKLINCDGGDYLLILGDSSKLSNSSIWGKNGGSQSGVKLGADCNVSDSEIRNIYNAIYFDGNGSITRNNKFYSVGVPYDGITDFLINNLLADGAKTVVGSIADDLLGSLVLQNNHIYFRSADGTLKQLAEV